MPFFSIVMPTRNRASLLRSSLKTAIEQSFQDYEIVVCDNNSKDDTQEVVREFMAQSSKVRYVNPGRDLSMCDNWEFALNEARGDFLIYLCDDDGLLFESLSYAHRLISRFKLELLTWPMAFYEHPDILEIDGPRARMTLHCDVMSGNLFEISSDLAIEGLCNFRGLQRAVPKMLNCAVNRSLVLRAREKSGCFFVPTFPDYSAACQLLSLTDSYHFIDLPLFIAGSSILSNAGLRHGRKQKNHEYVSLFKGDLLAGCPYPMRYLTAPYLLVTYLYFKKLYPEKFRYDMNMDEYFKSMFDELTVYEDYDDVSEEYEQLATYAKEYSGSEEMFKRLCRQREETRQAKENPEIRQARVSGLRRLTERTKSIVRKSDQFHRLAKKVKHYIAPPGPPPFFRYSNVGSLFEAASLLSDSLTRFSVSPEVERPILMSREQMPLAGRSYVESL